MAFWAHCARGGATFSGASDNFCGLLKFSGKIFKLSEKMPEVTGELPAEFSSCRISLPAAEKSLNSTMHQGKNPDAYSSYKNNRRFLFED